MSFQHRYYRDSYDARTISDDELASRYRAQFRRANVIGSTSAAWRILGLPGAPRVFTVREAAVGAFTLQFSPWHRVRLLTRFALSRATHRPRRRGSLADPTAPARASESPPGDESTSATP
jgi:hypothetical protein